MDGQSSRQSDSVAGEVGDSIRPIRLLLLRLGIAGDSRHVVGEDFSLQERQPSVCVDRALVCNESGLTLMRLRQEC